MMMALFETMSLLLRLLEAVWSGPGLIYYNDGVFLSRQRQLPDENGRICVRCAYSRDRVHALLRYTKRKEGGGRMGEGGGGRQHTSACSDGSTSLPLSACPYHLRSFGPAESEAYIETW